MGKVFTSFGNMSRAYNKARGEMIRFGLLWDGSKLDEVECLYEPLELNGLRGWMGFYQYNDKNIHFPAVYNGLDWSLGWTYKNSAIDVLRHEFAHALAHRYPKALRNGDLFKKAFGGPYGDRAARGTSPDDWEGRCVSGYAATATQEDFAETFMFYLKHKGKIPAKFAKKPAIRKKWKAVEKIIRRIAVSVR